MREIGRMRRTLGACHAAVVGTAACLPLGGCAVLCMAQLGACGGVLRHSATEHGTLPLSRTGYARGTHGVLTVLAEQVPAAQPHGVTECGGFAPAAFVRARLIGFAASGTCAG